MTWVLGKDLKVGDTIKVWWSAVTAVPNEDTITKLIPYTGRLAYLWPKGAQLASFRYLKSGMTIDNKESYERIDV